MFGASSELASVMEFGFMLIKVWGWQVKLCDPSLARANLSPLQMSVAQYIKPHT